MEIPLLYHRLCQLYNFFSKAFVTDNTAEKLLNAPENSKLRYKVFRQERFIDKTKIIASNYQKV